MEPLRHSNKGVGITLRTKDYGQLYAVLFLLLNRLNTLDFIG